MQVYMEIFDTPYTVACSKETETGPCITAPIEPLKETYNGTGTKDCNKNKAYPYFWVLIIFIVIVSISLYFCLSSQNNKKIHSDPTPV